MPWGVWSTEPGSRRASCSNCRGCFGVGGVWGTWVAVSTRRRWLRCVDCLGGGAGRRCSILVRVVMRAWMRASVVWASFCLGGCLVWASLCLGGCLVWASFCLGSCFVSLLLMGCRLELRGSSSLGGVPSRLHAPPLTGGPDAILGLDPLTRLSPCGRIWPTGEGLRCVAVGAAWGGWDGGGC